MESLIARLMDNDRDLHYGRVLANSWNFFLEKKDDKEYPDKTVMFLKGQVIGNLAMLFEVHLISSGEYINLIDEVFNTGRDIE